MTYFNLPWQQMKMNLPYLFANDKHRTLPDIWMEKNEFSFSRFFLLPFFFFLCITLLLLYSRVRSGRSSTAFALARVFFCCEVGEWHREKKRQRRKKTRRDGLVHRRVDYKKNAKEEATETRKDKALGERARRKKKRGERRLVGPFR